MAFLLKNHYRVIHDTNALKNSSKFIVSLKFAPDSKKENRGF